MRILFVAMTHSVHTARWIRLLDGTGWDLFLFPAGSPQLHPLLHESRRVVTWRPFPTLGACGNIRVCSVAPTTFLERAALRGLGEVWGGQDWRARWLQREIRRIRPDVVHSLEFQHAGYFCLAARDAMGDRFPTWVASNWGSDIYLFGRLAEHRDRVRRIVQAADYYAAECQRDVRLAEAMGLRARVLPVLPSGGGMELGQLGAYAQPGPTSARRIIAVKGYQHFAGRALTALQALSRCAEHLREYRIRVYSAAEDVRIAAELLALDTGLDVQCLPPGAPHEEILRLHGAARISLAVSISDAISTSLLEAMAMGSFPIQTWTACADEWIDDGRTGFLVPPDDPAMIAQRIVQALRDDELVDHAAVANRQVAAERLDRSRIRETVIRSYEEILHGRLESR